MSETIEVYSIEELKEKFPATYKDVIEDERNSIANRSDILWQEETFDSLKALIVGLGFDMKDYSMGLYDYGRSYIKLDKDHNAYDLKGARAFAYLENNLFCKHREIVSTKLRLNIWKLDHKGLNAPYRRYNKPGAIKDGFLTGYFADEVYTKALIENLKSGDTLGEALESLHETYSEILQAEYEHSLLEETIYEELLDLDWRYTETGKNVSL